LRESDPRIESHFAKRAILVKGAFVPVSPARRATIISAASHIPDDVITSQEAARRVRELGGLRMPEKFIEQMTGIVSRPVMLPEDQASTLAAAAGLRALHQANMSPTDIDLLIFASAGRDMVEPATAHATQEILGTKARCFDVSNACNSLIDGIDIAVSMIESGRAERALVVTGEAPSRAVKWDISNRSELIEYFAGLTFGDAGTALLLAPVESGDAGVFYRTAEAHSEHWELGGLFGGGSRHPRDPEWSYFRGDGRQLREAFEQQGDLILRRTLADTGTRFEDYRRILVHQVSEQYLDRFIAVTGIPPHLLVRTVSRYGNLAAATMGVQLTEVFHELDPGDRVLMVGLGGGISLATMAWQR
jgi:3-oxoacyl-[acyl-carrier-protein] synthase-3